MYEHVRYRKKDVRARLLSIIVKKDVRARLLPCTSTSIIAEMKNVCYRCTSTSIIAEKMYEHVYYRKKMYEHVYYRKKDVRARLLS